MGGAVNRVENGGGQGVGNLNRGRKTVPRDRRTRPKGPKCKTKNSLSRIFRPKFTLEIPPARATATSLQRRERDRRAITEPARWKDDPHTLWTDGSALPSGVAAAAVIGFVNPTLNKGTNATGQSISRSGHSIILPRGGNKRRGRDYGSSTRSIARKAEEGGYRSESWSLGAQSSSFDAELQALVRALEICALEAEEGATFRIFTDSHAAAQRLRDDRAGPGQALARRGIRAARLGIYDRGASVRVIWIPGHQGIPGNELADQCASNEAMQAEYLRQARKERGDIDRMRQGSISMTFIKGQARRQANSEWSSLITNMHGKRIRDFSEEEEGYPQDSKSPSEGTQESGIPLLPACIRTRNGNPFPKG